MTWLCAAFAHGTTAGSHTAPRTEGAKRAPQGWAKLLCGAPCALPGEPSGSVFGRVPSRVAAPTRAHGH